MEQKTILQLQKEMDERLRALGALKWQTFSGSYRGNRRLCGPFVGIEFPADMRIDGDKIKAIYYAISELYGSCFVPVREPIRGTRVRRVRVELKED